MAQAGLHMWIVAEGATCAQSCFVLILFALLQRCKQQGTGCSGCQGEPALLPEVVLSWGFLTPFSLFLHCEGSTTLFTLMSQQLHVLCSDAGSPGRLEVWTCLTACPADAAEEEHVQHQGWRSYLLLVPLKAVPVKGPPVKINNIRGPVLEVLVFFLILYIHPLHGNAMCLSGLQNSSFPETNCESIIIRCHCQHVCWTEWGGKQQQLVIKFLLLKL